MDKYVYIRIAATLGGMSDHHYLTV